MSARRGWTLVARRELVQRTRSKTFLVSSLLLVAFVVAGVVLSAVLREEGPERMRIVLVDRPAAAGEPSVAAIREALGPIGTALDIDARVRIVASRDTATELLRARDADVALDGRTAIWRTTVDDTGLAVVQAAVQTASRAARAEQLGLRPDQLQVLLAPVPIETTTVEPRSADQAVRTGAAAVGLVLLFLAVQVHGAAVLTGVVEEKSSRVVEVLLGHVRPRVLLAGKIIGIGVAGLLQVLLVAAAALTSLVAVRSIDAPKVPAGAIVWFVVWFVLGFALYATVFAGVGSLVSRQEDAQAVVTPATAPLLVAYFVGFAAVQEPDSTVARVASLVPFSAPMVMPVRLAASAPPLWEVVLSLALVGATIVAVLRLGARLYERNVLRSGAPMGFRHALAALRRR